MNLPIHILSGQFCVLITIVKWTVIIMKKGAPKYFRKQYHGSVYAVNCKSRPCLATDYRLIINCYLFTLNYAIHCFSTLVLEHRKSPLQKMNTMKEVIVQTFDSSSRSSRSEDYLNNSSVVFVYYMSDCSFFPKTNRMFIFFFTIMCINT